MFVGAQRLYNHWLNNNFAKNQGRQECEEQPTVLLFHDNPALLPTKLEAKFIFLFTSKLNKTVTLLHQMQP